MVDFLTEDLCLGIVTHRQPVFEPLEPRLLAFFVDLRFPDVLALGDVVDRRLRERDYFESLIDLLAVDAEHLLAVDPRIRERLQDGLIVLERALVARRPLDRAVLVMGRAVVLHSVEQHVGHVLAEVVCVALDVRQQRIEINEGGRVDPVEIGRILAFEHVDQ